MLTELLLEYRQLLPFAPPDVLDRVKALISPIQINFSIGTQISAIDVVDIWIASLDNTLNKDSFAWVYVLMLIRKASEKGHPLNRNLSHELSKRRSRSGRPLSSSGTWFEATRRLAANLFHVGRIGVPTDERARVLREAVSLLNFLISTDKAVSTPQTAKTYFGMRGVAYVLLGRNSEDRYEVYKQACEDLQKSRTFGNTGVEASCYLIEAQYHMYDIDRAEAHLDDAEEILNSITLDQSRDQIPWFASGEVNSRKGYACAARGDLGSALNHLEVAVESYRRTTLCAHDVRLSLDFLSMRYGQAALKLYTTRHELELSEDSDLLNLAIEKLPVGGESLPSALLIRSMNWRKMHKYGEMEADLIRARDALDGCSEEHDEFKQLNRPRCMAALCECSIQRAIERKDPSLAVEGLEHFLEFPVTLRDLSIVGPIYGIRFLLALDLPRYSDLAKKIAYNLRSRLAVSSENLESYRFGASHVSNILLTIATKLSDEHVVRVAYELSSSAVRRGDGAAPELIALAGEASLVLGKRTLARGDETGALDLFLEAGVFFENAIQIARSNGCSEAFSFRVAHSKAGEAYVRAHAFSGLEAHAVKAEHHLTSSRDLGNDAPELIGLLADIAYRRGSRNKNIADLMRALSLKENARIRGNNSRENRSVSSAAALTLWQLSSAIGDLTTAIQMALEASDRDPRLLFVQKKNCNIPRRPLPAMNANLGQVYTP